MNLVTASLSKFAKATPQKTALILLDEHGGIERFSYWLLEQQVLSAAGGLNSLNIPSGSILFIQCGNSLDSIVLFFAAIAAGHIAVPLSPKLSSDELERMAQRLNPALIFTVGDLELPSVPQGPAVSELLKLQSSLKEPVRQRPRDPAYILFTSGSSGQPRAVVHGHKVLEGRAPIRTQWLQLSDDDVLLHAGDFNWSYTLGCGLLDTWAEGATGALYTGAKTPKIWPALIVQSGATVFATVPSLFRRILKYADVSCLADSRLRFAVSAGEALSPMLYQQWKSSTGLDLYEALGMTECSTFISSGAEVVVRPGSPGKIQIGRHAAVLKENSDEPAVVGEMGRLAIHRDEQGLMLGYLEGQQSVDTMSADEWFITGDIVIRDEDDYLWHQGRSDDMLNVSGYRVSPLEIENTLLSHPSVKEVAVAATSAKSGVQLITAFVVRKDLSKAPDPTPLIDHIKDKLAEYKLPKRYVFVTRLPRNENGKILRRNLVKRFSAQQQ